MSKIIWLLEICIILVLSKYGLAPVQILSDYFNVSVRSLQNSGFDNLYFLISNVLSFPFLQSAHSYDQALEHFTNNCAPSTLSTLSIRLSIYNHLYLAHSLCCPDSKNSLSLLKPWIHWFYHLFILP